MVSFVAHESPPTLHNPNVSLNPTFIGQLGYLSISLISGIFLPVLIHLEVSSQIIQRIWNSQQLDIVSTQIEIEKQKLRIAVGEELGEEYLNKFDQLTFDEINQELLKKEYSQDAMQELLSNLARLREKEINLNVVIQENKNRFIAATLAMIPILGVLGAGAYIKTVSPDIQDRGLHGYAEALAKLFVKGFETWIHFMIYPLRDANSLMQIEFKKKESLVFGQTRFNDLQAKEIDVPVNRGHCKGKISAYLVPNPITHSFDSDRPVMVLFHGNNQTKEGLFNQTEFYIENGFNVMAVTMGGYPYSDDSILTTEISTYQDANAVILYLKEQGFKNIGIYGLSIGGTLAFAAAELHPDVIKLVVADQTLGRVKDVSANFMRNISKGLLPEAFIRGGVGGAFPTGQAVPGVLDSNGNPYTTDGLDNIRKAHVLRERAEQGLGECHVFAIKTAEDILMGRIENNDKFEENFADDIIMARYGNLNSHITELPGRHCSWFNDSSQSDDLVNELETIFFLKDEVC